MKVMRPSRGPQGLRKATTASFLPKPSIPSHQMPRQASASSRNHPPVSSLAWSSSLLAATHQIIRRHARLPLRRVVVEVVVLCATFIVIPPILAVGLYFRLSHSVRRSIRLELTDPFAATQVLNGHHSPLPRFFREASPITLFAVLILASTATVLRITDLGADLILAFKRAAIERISNATV